MLAGLLALPVAVGYGSVLLGSTTALATVFMTLIALGPIAISGRWAILRRLRRKFIAQGRERALLAAAESPALLPGAQTHQTEQPE